MILTCPMDQHVLDVGEWDLMSVDLKSGDSIYVWNRCPSGNTAWPSHWVSVTWKGKTPTVRSGPIVAVTPGKSYLPNRGIAPAPPPVRPVTVITSRVPRMVIRKPS